MIRQLDVAAAARVASTDGVDTVSATNVTVRIDVGRTDRLGPDVAAALSGRTGGGHERRVGSVLALRDSVVNATAATVQVVRVSVIDEDGAATSLEMFTTPHATTTYDDHEDSRQ